MNFSGHGNATALAVRKLNLQCTAYQFFCRAITKEKAWSPSFLANLEGSKWGSLSAGLVLANYAFMRRTLGVGDPDVLAFQVLGVDAKTEYRWTQHAPDGQRYHFMKRHKDQSDFEAYTDGCQFIFNNLFQWVSESIRNHQVVLEKIRRFQHASQTYKNDIAIANGPRMWDAKRFPQSYAQSEQKLRDSWRAQDNKRIDLNNEFKNIQIIQEKLALALHCLQDSFCPAHVLRSDREEGRNFLGDIEARKAEHYHVGTVDKPAPIRKLYSYDVQEKGMVWNTHSEVDSHSGSAHYDILPIAVQASADLISMGVTAILNNTQQMDWNSFKNKWLKYEPYPTKLSVPIGAKFRGTR